MNALLAPAVEQNTAQVAPIHCILLLDDEIDLWWERDIAALTAAGYDVDTAEDGEAGWNALQTNDYDLLITDNNMPKLWGSELIERLRNHGMKLPIIFASSLLPVIDAEHRAHFLNVQLLEKPVSAAQLLASVEKSRARAGGGSGQGVGRPAEAFRRSRCCSCRFQRLGTRFGTAGPRE